MELSGAAFGVEIRGSLPAEFADFLRPAGTMESGGARALDVGYRTVSALPEVEEIWVAEPSEPAIRDRFALFRQPDGFGLSVRSESAGLFRFGARRIDVEWLPGGVGAAHFFFAHALPLWLESRGVTVLHASAVSLGDRAVAFVGPSGAGKSTLCAELVRAGCGFVADDGLAMDEDERGDWRCLPGPPWLRLWPSALEGRLGLAAADLPRVHDTLEKRRLPAGGAERASVAGGPTLAAVYLLDRRPREEDGGSPAISVCTRREGLVHLVEHSLAAAPLAALGLAGERLDRLARLAARVEVRRLRLPAGEDSAQRVREALLADLGTNRVVAEGGGGRNGAAERPIATADATSPAAAAAAAGIGNPAAERSSEAAGATAAPAAERHRPPGGGSSGARFTPSPRVRARRVGGETVLLDLGSDRYFTLDEVGAEIWAGLERGLAAGEILAELVGLFDAEEERVRADLDALLAELLAEGLIRPAAG